MEITCPRWVTLASAGPRRHANTAPGAYLNFVGTGLLVGLPDEPGMLIDPDLARPQVFLREADALGLGLQADDLAAGVAFCVDAPSSPVGWTCTPLDLEIGDAGEVRTRQRPLAVGIHPAPPPASTAAARTRQTLLILVTEEAIEDGTLDNAIAVAVRERAAVVLAAVGELPETGRHASEERSALGALLDRAAVHIGAPGVARLIDLGGDPVRGVTTLASDCGATIVAVPASTRAATAWQHAPLTAALRERLDARVVEVPPVPPDPSDGDTSTALRTDRLRIALPASIAHAPDTAWQALVAATASEALLDAWRPLLGSRYEITVRWRLVPTEGLRPDRLPVSPLVDALLDRARASGVAPRGPHGVRVELLEAAGPAEECVELTVAAA
jgi:hypothetical protein